MKKYAIAAESVEEASKNPLSRCLFAKVLIAFALICSLGPTLCQAGEKKVSSWAGLYAGGHIGWSKLSDIEQSTTFGFGASTGPYSGNGLIGGATLGANWQHGSWVIGVEGDYSWANLRANAVDVAPTCTTGGVGTCFSRIRELSTLRARVGLLTNNILFYATGGLSYGSVTSGVVNPGLSASAEKFESGWTAGLGIEAEISSRWTSKLEYIYVDLSAPSYVIAALPAQFDSTHARTHILRFGINYRFGN